MAPEKFPRDLADYKKLELLVAKIQRDLAPNSRVTHNARLQGRSGALRQIDVLVEDRIGQYDIRIVLDCKDYKVPVDIKDVEECSGLFEDVCAQRGVIVCPAGFTKNAKARAQQLQIDLYSPVDTEPHKWQARVKVPALCDFRNVKMSLGIASKTDKGFRLDHGFQDTLRVMDEETGNDLGTMVSIMSEEWFSGRYPIDPGIHERQPLLPRRLTVDNGYGSQIHVDLSVEIFVEKALFYGQFQITRLSGFHDAIKGGVITNAFAFGILSPDEIVQGWRRIKDLSEAPVRPVLELLALSSSDDVVSPK